MTSRDKAKYLVEELKQEQFFDKLFKQNTIDFNNYFKYSGKTEKDTQEMKEYLNIEEAFNKMVIDFKKLEEYKQCIREERKLNYERYTKPKKKWRKKKIG